MVDAEILSGARRQSSRNRGRPSSRDATVGADELVRRATRLLRTMAPSRAGWASLAAASGVHQSLYQYYFKDRSRLMAAVARHLLDDLAEKVALVNAAPDLAAAAKLQNWIASCASFHDENPNFSAIIAEATEQGGSRELLLALRERTQIDVEMVAGILADGERQGWRPRSPEMVLALVVSMSMFVSDGNHFLRHQSDDLRESRRRRDNLLAALVDLITEPVVHASEA